MNAQGIFFSVFGLMAITNEQLEPDSRNFAQR